MKIPQLRSKDLVTIADLNGEEIRSLFRFAAVLKSDAKRGRYRDILKRRSLAMIFEKSSTRTRVSFEVGITQLGGHALFLGSNDIQIRRGETIHDTAMVLSRYVDGIMIRTHAHENVVEFAENASVPVINGLSDSHHPCQALADYFTIFEREGDFRDARMAYIGDGNNVAHSLIECAAALGSSIIIASPPGFTPDESIVQAAMAVAEKTGGSIAITHDPEEAVRDAAYVYTDVWVSMGEEDRAEEKKRILAPYRITASLLAKGRNNCRVMHCLPAHRGEEIDAEVLDSDRSIVFDQAENRLHIQKAVLCTLMAR